MPGRRESDDCLDELPFFVPITMGCGCHIEFHCVHPPQPDLAVLRTVPCPWCKAEEPGVPEEMREIARQHDHLHAQYRRGDAAFRKSELSPAEWDALGAMEAELQGLELENGE